MKTSKTLALTVAALMVASTAYAQMTLKTPEEFAKATAVSNLFEIKSSELALQKSNKPEIKGFAQQMITDHTKAIQEFMAVLPKSTVALSTVPKTLDEAHQVVYDKLDKAEGEEFDKAYVMAQVDAHKEAVMQFTNYSNNGSDKVLKDFAAKTLPVLESHQDHVENLHNSKLNMH